MSPRESTACRRRRGGFAGTHYPARMASTAGAIIRAVRPRQWVKNLLVISAPLAAGQILDLDVLVPTVIAFVGFCLASSAVYLINDVADAEVDRLHPRKRFRPIASGELSPRAAVVVSGVLMLMALVVCVLAAPMLAALVLVYLAMQVGYSLWAKHEPLIDLACVATGFVLRAVAGGVAAGLELSHWFLMVTGFGSLFLVAGKRFSELHTVGVDAGTRRSLVRYSATYLQFVWSTAAAATVVFYALWASVQPIAGDVAPWLTISVLPFVLGVMRYAMDIDRAQAEEPERLLFSDRVLQVVGVAWFVVTCLGVFDV